MFHNYFFLKKLASGLEQELNGFELFTCFSQNKDELVLGFGQEEKLCYIRANLNPVVSLIQITDSFARAGKNSVDLFQEIINLKVSSVSAFEFERSFMITFEEQYSVIFKMHNRRANLLLARKEKVVDIFRKKLSQDFDLTLSDLQNPISITRENFLQHGADPLELIPALGKEVKIHLEKIGFYREEQEKKWIDFNILLDKIEKNPIYLMSSSLPGISLINESSESTTDAIYATNWLYEKTVRMVFFEKEKEQITNRLKRDIRKSESYIEKTRQKLNEQESSRNPEEIANILMANLHSIQKGLSKIVLTDFYTSEPITIKLNTTLSPQKNAEQYYRKSKNRYQEIDSLKKNIRLKEALIEKLSKQVLQIEEVSNYKELRKFSKNFQITSSLPKEKNKPYHQYLSEGWTILVGKNSKANDELTLKIANKNDLWLHAKDVAGSHVVIKEQPGQNFPTSVIEFAASLAAANSKRKTDSLCPVIYTPKKFVRKAKGSPHGQVIVEKEMVLMVEPYGT